MNDHLASPFQNNRAELLPDDVWGEFIIPTYYDSLEPILLNHKPLLITGGRGCGKTIFLRFLSHQTALGKKRQDKPPEFNDLISLYWKPDIGFLGIVNSDWLGQKYLRVFEHYVAISLLLEFSKSIESLSNYCNESEKSALATRELPASVHPYLPPDIVRYSDLEGFAIGELAKLDVWVGSPELTAPTFLRPASLLKALTFDLRKANPKLRSLCLRVFVDEYERLGESQRIVLNDYVRDSNKDLIFCFALRKYCIDTFPLSRNGEFLKQKNDYNTIDIEDMLSGEGKERNFELLAAEMLLLKLHKNKNINLETDTFKVSHLFDPKCISFRKEKKYQDELLSIARRILPQTDASEIVNQLFTDSSFKNRWSKAVETGIKQHKGSNGFNVSDFEFKEDPASSLVAACVLNRRKPGIVEIKKEFDRVKTDSSKDSRFKRSGGWNENTLHGALWYLYQGLPDRDCLLYSGFSRFCQMSSPNMRYFQELCKVTFTIFEENKFNVKNLISNGVPTNIQARAAKIASTELFEDIAKGGLDFPEFSRHSIMSKLNWRVVNERYKIYS